MEYPLKYGRTYPPKPNPQFDSDKAITLEQWEAKGQPRTDFMCREAVLPVETDQGGDW
jgi:hypothetical protein